jgi:hypothetical protein
MRVNGGIIGNSLVPNTIDRSNQSGLFTLDNSLRGYGGALGDSTLKLVGFAEFNTTGAGSYLGSSSQLVNGLQPNDVIYWIMTDAYVGSTTTTTAATYLNNAYLWYGEAYREPFDGVAVNFANNRELAFYDVRRNRDSSRAILSSDLNTTILGAYRSYIVTGYGIVTQPGNYRIYTNTSGLPSGSSTYYKHTYAFVFRNVDINRLTTYRANYGISNPYTPYTRVLLGNSLQLSASPYPGYYQTDDNFRNLTLPSGNDRDTTIGVVISTYDVVSEWPDYLNSKNRGYDRKNLGSGYFSMLTTDKFSSAGLTTHAFIGGSEDMQLTTYVPGTASTYYPTNSNLYISAYSVMVPSL